MKFSTQFIASGLLSLLCVTTAGAHDTEHPMKVHSATQKPAAVPMTCPELATAKKNKVAMNTPDMLATEKRCKAEADAKAAATKKLPAIKNKRSD